MIAEVTQNWLFGELAISGGGVLSLVAAGAAPGG
jgi:hypothetical protein